MSSIHASPKGPGEFLSAAAVIFSQIDEISIHNRVIIWEAVFGSVGRSNVTFFFLSLSSVDEAVPPWMWGKTVGGRSQQPRNTSPPPIASLPLSHKHGNPPHSVSRTHARSLPQPRWEKTWPHRAPSSRRGETRRKVYAELKKNDLFVWISRSGVLFIPSLARKTGRSEDRRARATTGKPRTTMETMAPAVSFPHEQARERNPSPLPKQRCQLCLPHSHPTPPEPVRSGARGRGAATPYLRAKPIRGTATRPSPRQVSKARKERQKQSGRAEEDLPRSHGSQPRPRPAVLTALFTSSSS